MIIICLIRPNALSWYMVLHIRDADWPIWLIGMLQKTPKDFVVVLPPLTVSTFPPFFGRHLWRKMHIKVTVRSVLRGKLLTSESPPFKTTCLCCWRLLYLLFYKAKICIWQQITCECSRQRKSIYNLLISLIILRYNNNNGAPEDFFFNYYYLLLLGFFPPLWKPFEWRAFYTN